MPIKLSKIRFKGITSDGPSNSSALDKITFLCPLSLNSVSILNFVLLYSTQYVAPLVDATLLGSQPGLVKYYYIYT